ncbi:MAG: hypothetical protein JW861_05740 [Bacteroidales bacterium]|nr:hypothetical protein [Bacteroidales bacterium]
MKTSRLILSIVLAFLTCCSLVQAEEVFYPDSWGGPGFTLERATSADVRVSFSVTQMVFESVELDGESMQVIRIPGIFLFNDEGAPDLPGTGRYIAVPQGATASLRIIASRVEKLENISIAPAPRIPLDTETGPLHYEKNMELYSRNAFYPEKPVILSDPDKIRGVDVVMLGITPFQYNPVTRELLVYRDIQVEVVFEGGNGHFGEDRLRSKWFDPMLSDALLNWQSLPEIDYSRPQPPSDTPDYEYIIITPNDATFIAWSDSLKRFRTEQGIRTGVVTTTEIGGNTTTAIESYVNNAYNTWAIPPVGVLLMGDYGTSGNTVVSPIWDGYCVSDNIYADVTGNSMPDITFARMTAQNSTHVQTMVTKVLNYERNPPTSAYFYSHPVTALGWQTERWFQICSETVGGFWKHVQGKTPVRINAIYSGTPGTVWSTATNTSTVVNYFGPSGLGYIPATPAELGGWSGGTATMVNNAVNAGCFMLQHRDHGGTSGWGEPAYSSSNINGLTNTALTFVWSVNCLTGKYNYSSEVFAEKFHRYTYNGQNSGALGIIAASEVSYSFVNDTYVWGAYDNMWPEFMPAYGSTPAPRGVLPAFANSAGKYFLQQSSWPYNTSNKEVTYNLFHHHGDAFSVVYSEVPQNLTVSHAASILAGVTSFSVTANTGSLIALSCNGTLLGTATGTGSPVSITIPPLNVGDEMIVTVTKQNYFRYRAVVPVIPAAGPYVSYVSHNIHDAGGNNNGQADYGEPITVDVTLENTGSATANGVVATLSTTDTYVTITDNTQSYGNIPAGGSATQNNAFAFTVDSYIPDLHVVTFDLTINDNSEATWTSGFTVTLHAPVLTPGSLTVDDATGGNGNGMLDPGETANIIIQTSNTGSSASPSAEAALTSGSIWITITYYTANVGVINSGATVNPVFTILVDAGTPIGTSVDLNYQIIAGSYSASQNYAESVGLVVEDWETGTMTKFEWETGGSANWYIVTESPWEGTYCLRSGAIGDNQSTSLAISFNVTAAGTISFYRKVSSEASYDYLRFYIDGVQQGQWAGTVAWGQVSYPVSTGNHTFQWTYVKDANTIGGSDCAWLDYIVFPPVDPETAMPLPYSTDFDLSGALPDGWKNAMGDDFDWTARTGSTPSSNTGPSGDHTTGSGYYLYTESSSPNYPSKRADLVSPKFDLSGLSDAQATFWYHMYGTAMGTLHLDLYDNGTWINDVMTPISGNQGNAWYQRSVDLTSYVGHQIKLRFRGITGTSFTSDMAVDDFWIGGTLAPSTILDLKVYLEGPYTGMQMGTFLNTYGYLPTSQPYNMSPYFYTGSETANPIPGSDVVDWVLVELRETSGTASGATASTMIGRQAALLLEDGSVVGTDGISPLEFNLNITENLYVVVWHRNHLGIISSNPLQKVGGIYTYDFTDANGKVYGGSNAHKEISTGVWGMAAGDGDCDGQITTGDKIDIWVPQSGMAGYLQGDFNMNGNVENGDKIDCWGVNAGMGCQVP